MSCARGVGQRRAEASVPAGTPPDLRSAGATAFLTAVGWSRCVALVLALSLPTPALAQADYRPFGKEQLDQLTAQIALFPDALLSQVLMAATYPADVAAAAAWSRANPDQKGDAAVMLVDEQPWDPSVQSLVAFPQVIVMVGENPSWVKDLGDAFLLQPEDVMDSVQRLRAAAQAAGNLQSNEEIIVTVENRPPPAVHIEVTAPPPPPQVIVIEQRRPDVVFVPIYNPVFIFRPWLWPAFPPVFIPPPPGFWWSTTIATGVVWGVGIGVSHAMWGQVNWWNRSVHINVSRHNSIHVRNRIDRRDRDVRWSHDTNRRREVPYRGGDATRQRLRDRAARIEREQFRGRDADRQRAEQALRDRGISTDRSALRDANRDALRRQAPNVGREAPPARPRGDDRAAARDRVQGADRGAAGRAPGLDRAAARDRAQGAQRVPTLQGVGDRQARQQIDRGNASRQSMQQQLQSRPPAQRPASAGAARSQAQSGRGAAPRPPQRPQGGGVRPSR